MPSEEAGSEIGAAIADIGHIYALGGIFIAELSADGKTLSPIHTYSATDPPYPLTMLSIGPFPEMLEKIKHGDLLIIPGFSEDHEGGSAVVRMNAESSGIHSVVIIPVTSGSVVTHVLSAFRLQKTDFWPEDVIACLRRAAELFSSALERMATAAILEETTSIEELLNEISSTYINLPPREIEHVVTHDLGRLSGLIGADRYVICLAEDFKTNSTEFRFSFDYWPNELRDKIEAEQAWLMTHGGA